MKKKDNFKGVFIVGVCKLAKHDFILQTYYETDLFRNPKPKNIILCKKCGITRDLEVNR